jgi:hypothetical protein
VAAGFEVDPEATGEAVVEFADAGAWQLVLDGEGSPDVVKTRTVQ